MDLVDLDHSSKVTPLLVQLYDSHRLSEVARDEKPLARAELTSAITELLEMNLSSRESELVADVLITLMRQAEHDLRHALAEKLSVMDNVPLRLMLQLANDQTEIAGPVLSKSKVFSDLDLIYIIKSKGEEHWQHIAKRKEMSDQIINILVDTGEQGTVLNLLENKDIKLTEYAVDVASNMACYDEVLAKPLLMREEVGEEIARRIYHYVGEALREEIARSYNLDGSISDMVEETITEFSAQTKHGGDMLPSSSMLSTAERQRDKGLLTLKMMLSSLRRSQTQTFIAQFAKFTGMTSETVADMLAQQSGQGLAVACKAFNICKADFMSIFLLTNRLRNKDKMVDLKDMEKAMGYYARVDEKVAMDIIKNSLDEALN